MSKWVSSSALSTTNSKPPLKRKARGCRAHSKWQTEESLENGLWIERFKPRSRDQLAVHKKKIIEVDEWLQRNVLDDLPHSNASK